jgi:hypothetical protein
VSLYDFLHVGAGRDTDAAVHLARTGRTVIAAPGRDGADWFVAFDDGTPDFADPVPPYSTYPGWAWLLIAEIAKDFALGLSPWRMLGVKYHAAGDFVTHSGRDKGEDYWWVDLGDNERAAAEGRQARYAWATGDTMPLAACRAFLYVRASSGA